VHYAQEPAQDKMAIITAQNCTIFNKFQAAADRHQKMLQQWEKQENKKVQRHK